MSPAEAAARALIGVPGGRERLATPILVLDRDALDRNIAAMAAFARTAGLALRPHAKTHKSVQVARRQVAAGAAGQCCSKLGEAEALAAGGVAGLHITSPVVNPAALARLSTLMATAERLSVVADHPDNVRALAAAARDAGRRLEVVVDVDPGIHRTGVADADAALAIAEAVAAEPALAWGGVQFYCGAEQHVAAYADRREALKRRNVRLEAVLARLAAAGVAIPRVTGGGTGSHAIDAELGLLTELQVGSYVFMDREYAECELAPDSRSGAGAPFEVSLTVEAGVVSANHAQLSTVDAGLKAFATDGPTPTVRAGAAEGSQYRFMGDEHGAIVPPEGAAPPPLGARVTLGVPHCDPTVNLYDAYNVVSGDTLVELWPVDARGRLQ